MDSTDHRSARRVHGSMNFIGPMHERPRYHANDSSLDVLELEAHSVEIEDARMRASAPTLQREGFAIFPHASAVRDFRDAAEVARLYVPEIRDLLLRLKAGETFSLTGRHFSIAQMPGGPYPLQVPLPLRRHRQSAHAAGRRADGAHAAGDAGRLLLRAAGRGDAGDAAGDRAPRRSLEAATDKIAEVRGP